MIDTAVLKQALGDLDGTAVEGLIAEFVGSGASAEEAQTVVDACQKGMELVGDQFDSGTYFVGDL
ncbi:MAG: B12-binding domain-containing protein, partial [Clostridiales Family XIII bacterium]|nr:B12-binding domain-containing protein [Clostridiales Family XIII bacterium]